MNKATLESSVNQELRQLAENSDGFTVAFSGGLDSTVLLHLCKRFCAINPELSLQAVHVNHGLSANASSWESHCKTLCEQWQISLSIQHLTIIPESRTSLEQQARDARYQAIEQSVHNQYCILLGQHQNDQAETYLLQLARGSGTEGLSGMPKRFTSANGSRYGRPLLDITRQQLFEYARLWQLNWVEDESNVNEHFYRNFVRRKVIPVLQQKWPSITSTISRSARHHAHAAAVIDEYMQLLSESVIDTQGDLNILAWSRLSEASRISMLRHWLKPRVSSMPSAAVLEQISLLPNAQSDAQPECRWSNYVISRHAGKLVIRNFDKDKQAHGFDIVLDKNASYTHPSLAYSIAYSTSDASQANFDSTKHYFVLSDSSLRVEFGGFARVCKLDPKRPSKPIKKWLQEWQVPPWERAKVPILMHKNQVLALGANFAIVEQTHIDSADAVFICIQKKSSNKKSPLKAGKD